MKTENDPPAAETTGLSEPHGVAEKQGDLNYIYIYTHIQREGEGEEQGERESDRVVYRCLYWLLGKEGDFTALSEVSEGWADVSIPYGI